VHVPVPSVFVQGVVTQTSRPWHDKKCFGPFALFDLHGKEDVPEGSASMVNRCDTGLCLLAADVQLCSAGCALAACQL
jgi:hypothetical protein